ncbi:MAG: succinylglutamate desuccinylase/aspartoacylase family protein [Acidiferrobacterales bacterium]|nr:succinylglutamate desuccinylase/aspartoacylase family protein [Acidiferrobacterales bacterium]
MAVERIITEIRGDGPGRLTELNGYRIGPVNPVKKVYLQGALHADEQPGIMALSSLLPLLFEADRTNQLTAEFVVFPMVNPLGMGTVEFGMHQGRYDLPSGVNFNRDWPDLFLRIEQNLKGKLTDNVTENRTIILNTVRSWLETEQFVSARMQLRRAVMLEAYDADYVFDLHCDDLSLLHIFSSPHCNPQMESLGNWLSADAILTAEDSGGGSFDEVWPLLWLRAADAFPNHPIPVPPAACTIELRGQNDVGHEFGQRDATALFGFFQSEGLILGETVIPPKENVRITPLNATEILRVDRAGLLDYQVHLGDWVKTGEVVAHLIPLEGEQPFVGYREICAGTDGLVLSINSNKYVWQGRSIAKIVGNTPLASRGDYLLED